MGIHSYAARAGLRAARYTNPPPPHSGASSSRAIHTATALATGFGIAGAVALACESVQLAVVQGRSMQPTLNGGCPRGERRDRVLAERLSPILGRTMQRGDVVVLSGEFEKDGTREKLIKRVTGVGGDTVLRRWSSATTKQPRETTVEVPPGHLWVEGDNLKNSLDSRAFGSVPASAVESRVLLKLWPLREAGVVR